MNLYDPLPGLKSKCPPRISKWLQRIGFTEVQWVRRWVGGKWARFYLLGWSEWTCVQQQIDAEFIEYEEYP